MNSYAENATKEISAANDIPAKQIDVASLMKDEGRGSNCTKTHIPDRIEPTVNPNPCNEPHSDRDFIDKTSPP